MKLLGDLELRARERRTDYGSDPRAVAAVGAAAAVGPEPGGAGVVLIDRLHTDAGQAPGPGATAALLPPLRGA